MKKQTVYAIGAGVCLALGCYALMGLLQAVMVFEGERATSNYRFWGPLTALFLGLGVVFALRAYRYSLEQLRNQIKREADQYRQ